MFRKEIALSALGFGMIAGGMAPAVYHMYGVSHDAGHYVPHVSIGWAAQSPVGGPEMSAGNILPGAELIVSLGAVAAGLVLTYRNIKAMDDYDAFDYEYRSWQAQGMPVAREEKNEEQL